MQKYMAKGRAIIFLVMWNLVSLHAQVSEPNVLHALRVKSGPRLDGRLDEPCWQRAVKIDNFTQRELHEGEPATERTQIAAV